MKFTFDLMKLTPYGAGSPPAVVLGFSLYKTVLSAAGADFAPLAAAVAIVGAISMVSGEIFAYRQVFKALAMRDLVAFLLSLAGALFCSMLVILAVYSGADTKSLLTAVMFSVAIYAMFGIDAYLKTRQEQRREKIDEMDAERRLTNARTRNAKASSGKTGHVQPSSGQLDRLNPQLLARAKNWREANPDGSARNFAKTEKISPMTASKYLKAAK